MAKSGSKKMGRPVVEIDEKTFKGLCNIQCTLDEIAGFFDCTDRTIERWCHKSFGMTFVASYKRFSSQGKISLRRAQFRNAIEKGNATLQIWLGKQYLGQKDKMDFSEADGFEFEDKDSV